MGKYQDEVNLLISARNDARAEMQKAEADIKAATQREQQRQRAQAQSAEQIRQVNRRIRDAELQAQGRGHERELLRLRDHYADRIRAARQAGDAELAQRLRQLQRLEQAEMQSAQRRALSAQGAARVGGAGNARGAVASQSTSGGGFLSVGESTLLKGLGAVAAVAGAADVARGLVDAVGHAMAGEFDQAAADFRAMPVFGAIVGLGQSLREMVTGERKEIEEMQRKSAEMDARNRQYMQNRAARDAFREFGLGLQSEVAMADMDQFDQARLQAALARRDAEKQIDEFRDKAGDQMRHEEWLMARRLAAQKERNTLDEIDRAEQAQREKEEADAAKEVARIRMEAAREERDIRVQGIQNEIRQSRQNEQAIADRLGRFRDAERRSSAPENTASQDRYLTGVRDISTSNDRARVTEAQKQTKAIEAQLQEAKAATSALQDILDQLRSMPLLEGGEF